MTLTVARLTIDDYHTIIASGVFEGRSIELLNGWIVEMPPEGPEHADSSTNLLPLLWNAASDRYQVRPAKPITIPGSNSEPEPDIALVRPQSYRQSHPFPEDVFLVIEFSNTSLTKDLEEKRKIYAAAGILDYWIVNLRDRQIIVLRNPVNGNYQSEERYSTGSLSPLAFPDVIIQINTLLT
jgi:Uma2 family endonuclease